MNITFLDAKTLGEDIVLDKIKALGECNVNDSTPCEKIAERIENADVVIVNKLKLNKSNLENAKKLKLICVTATGFDNIDVAYCREKGIGVCNVTGYSSHSVAQVTAAMVLYLSTHLGEYTDYVRNGAYTKNGIANKLSPIFHELYGKNWGIIGYGNIGREVGAVATALGCTVLPYRKAKTDETVDFETLLKSSDIITVHTPLNEGTRGLIGEKELNLMKKDVILVNTARGAVTDEEAVARAVETGRIGAFGTDVYAPEPFGENHPMNRIKAMPNVCLTPHMAWGAFEARSRCIAEIAENIKCFANGEIRNRVDL